MHKLTFMRCRTLTISGQTGEFHLRCRWQVSFCPECIGYELSKASVLLLNAHCDKRTCVSRSKKAGGFFRLHMSGFGMAWSVVPLSLCHYALPELQIVVFALLYTHPPRVPSALFCVVAPISAWLRSKEEGQKCARQMYNVLETALGTVLCISSVLVYTSTTVLMRHTVAHLPPCRRARLCIWHIVSLSHA